MMVNFELSTRQDSNPWPPEHIVDALPLSYENSKRAGSFNLGQKFTIFDHLSLLKMNFTVLILAVSRAPVTYELS